MRIVGDIPHPHYKITVFEMNQRLSLQIEDSDLQQLYKFADGVADHYSDVVAMISDLFLTRVDNVFNHMKAAKLEAIKTQGQDSEDDFPEII
jgi:hypothetical protein